MKNFDEVRYLRVAQARLNIAEQALIAYFQPRLNLTRIVFGRACERFLLEVGLDDTDRLKELRALRTGGVPAAIVAARARDERRRGFVGPSAVTEALQLPTFTKKEQRNKCL